MSHPTPEKPTPEQLETYARRFNENIALQALGVRMDVPSNGRVVIRLDPIQPWHRGGLGTNAVNGGVLAAIFDLVIGTTPALIDPTRRTATMQLSISFEKPVMGDRLSAEAWIDRAGGSVLFSSAEIKDGQGDVCARCHGLVRISSLPWAAENILGIG